MLHRDRIALRAQFAQPLLDFSVGITPWVSRQRHHTLVNDLEHLVLFHIDHGKQAFNRLGVEVRSGRIHVARHLHDAPPFQLGTGIAARRQRQTEHIIGGQIACRQGLDKGRIAERQFHRAKKLFEQNHCLTGQRHGRHDPALGQIDDRFQAFALLAEVHRRLTREDRIGLAAQDLLFRRLKQFDQRITRLIARQSGRPQNLTNLRYLAW